MAVGVAHRVAQLRRRGRGAFGAEAHVDRLRAVVGGVDDGPAYAGLREVALLDQQTAVIACPGEADAVIGDCAGQARDMRAVSGAIDNRRPFAGIAVEVVSVCDLARQVGMRGVHARIDHTHLGAIAVRDAPRLGKVLKLCPPLKRRARRRARRGLGQGQSRVVRGRLERLNLSRERLPPAAKHYESQQQRYQ